MEPERHGESGLLGDRDGTVVGAELVATGASGPGADELAAGVEAETLALGRGVETGTKVDRGDDVEESLRGKGVLLDAKRLRGLEEGRADVEVLAVGLGDEVGLEVEELGEEVEELGVVPLGL